MQTDLKQKNKKIQQTRRGVMSRQHSLVQPNGPVRVRPGETGQGEYYRIIVRDQSQFENFRNQDVGVRGHIQRLAGQRANGSWDTQAWLVSKTDAHMSGSDLIPDTPAAKNIFEQQLGSKPRQATGDIFEADPRPDIPEVVKPTPAQRRARQQNIKKAQAARRKKKNKS